MNNQRRPLPWGGLAPGFARAFAKTGSAVAAIGAAGLEWEVGLEPVYLASENDPRKLGKKVARHQAVVRRDNGLPLGVVGLRYKPIQNRQMLEFVDALLKVRGFPATPVAVGEHDAGRRAFVVLHVQPQKAVVERWAKVDSIHIYLVVTNAHDGTAAFRVGVLPIRLVCTNQLRLQLSRNQPGFWSFRHISRVAKHVTESTEQIADYLQGFEQVMVSLGSARFSDQELESFLEELLPIRPDATVRTANNRRRYRDGIRQEYRDSANGMLVGTRWGALNAVAAWEQWGKPLHAAGTDRIDWLFSRLIMERGNEYVNRALRLLT